MICTTARITCGIRRIRLRIFWRCRAWRSAYASLMSASVMVEQNALKTQQSADASYRDSEMDRLDYINSQDAVVAQVQSAFAAYNQVKKTIPLMEKSVELQELSMQLTQKRQQLGQATQIDV